MTSKTLPERFQELAEIHFEQSGERIKEWRKKREQSEQVTDTRERIFFAARKTFARKGSEATVRDICKEAGANLAGVNYYFGNKDKLLAAVLADFLREVSFIYPFGGGVSEDASPEERFFGFILSQMSGMLLAHGEEYAKLNRLLLDAFLNDFEPFEEAGDSFWVEMHDFVIPIIDDLTGKKWDLIQLEKLSAGFFSQILFYAMHMDDLLMGREGEQLSQEEVIGIAQHITAFSIGGMKNYSEFMDAENDFPNLCSIEHCKRARRANRL